MSLTDLSSHERAGHATAHDRRLRQWHLFGLDRPEIDRMWRVLLAVCVRDRATARSWHPWRLGGPLFYLVHWQRRWLVRPPAELDPLVLAAARDLLAPSRLRSVLARWFGWPVAPAVP